MIAALLRRKSYVSVVVLILVGLYVFYLYSFDHGVVDQYRQLVKLCNGEKDQLYDALSHRRESEGLKVVCPKCAANDKIPACKVVDCPATAVAKPAEAVPCKPGAPAAAATEPDWDFAIVIFVGHRCVISNLSYTPIIIRFDIIGI